MVISAGMTTTSAARPSPETPSDVARERFIERMGMLSQADGMPRIAGRLLALLVLDGGPLAFGELAERLSVSRGSVSSNMRLLEGMGVAERVARPGERGDSFQLAPDPYVRLLSGVVQRAQRGREVAIQTRDALGVEGADPATLARLDELARFHAALVDLMTDLDGSLT